MGKPAADEADASALGFDMTPMIDVVFQLIVFLMLANDLGAREIEDLSLPEAFEGREDGGDREPRRLIVNVLRPDRPGAPPVLKVRGAAMDLRTFRDVLSRDADLVREKRDPFASELFLLLRADRGSRWGDVRQVLQACGDPAVKVYRLQFATTAPEAGRGR